MDTRTLVYGLIPPYFPMKGSARRGTARCSPRRRAYTHRPQSVGNQPIDCGFLDFGTPNTTFSPLNCTRGLIRYWPSLKLVALWRMSRVLIAGTRQTAHIPGQARVATSCRHTVPSMSTRLTLLQPANHIFQTGPIPLIRGHSMRQCPLLTYPPLTRSVVFCETNYCCLCPDTGPRGAGPLG
jgi:hypothetical protein